MRELRIPDVSAPWYWTAWEFPDDWSSGLAHRRAFAWVKKKSSRSASVWRLADDRKTRWFVVALSEHSLVLEALEKRLAKEQGSRWYDLPEQDLIALARRRASDALDALGRGAVSESGSTQTERHFGGRYKLNPDGSLEPLDRNQG